MLILLKQSEEAGVINAFYEAENLEELTQKIKIQIPNPLLVEYFEVYKEPQVPLTPIKLVDGSRFTLLKL